MLYVGQGLASANGDLEPALVDPSLRVNHRQPDPAGTTMGYWPSYSEIAPEARAAYLSWLATGRRDPHAYVGYVFLFFYGLERRALIDIANDSALEWELPLLHAEVQRLLSIYGSNDSFHRYATRFIDLLDVLIAAKSTAPVPLPVLDRDNKWQPPRSLLVQLGTFASAGQPVPADWAVAWAWYHRDVPLRTAATRCTDEFVRLFKTRYAATYQAGIMARPGHAIVSLEYTAASGGIASAALTTNIPNVFDDPAAGRQLAALAETVLDDLEPYSRYLGRDPEGRGTVAAAALLPPELLGQPTGETARLRDWATDLADRRQATNGTELFAYWPTKSPERMSKPEAVALAQLLSHFGLAVEPDVRLGGQPINLATPVVLFHAAEDQPKAATAAYAAATTLLQLATAVSAADGTVSEEEQQHLVTHLKSSLQLTAGERARLEAHLLWLMADDIKLTGLKRRIEVLTKTQREAVGDLLVSVAAADGVISPEEVTSLTKIFRLLSLDPSQVHSRLHDKLSGGAPQPAASEPVTVRPAGEPDAGYPVPSLAQGGGRHRRAASETAGETSLNVAAIEAKFAETARVSALLTDIFSEDEPASAPTELHRPSSDADLADPSTVAGLDLVHSAMLRKLAGRDHWTRASFEELASEYGVLPDGAIDRLNEAALDAVDEPFLEEDGDDRLTINDFVRQELLA